MPVRIYSLAKELKIDSKELVDICTAAGVTGKGSALASLTEEEVVQVKAYLAKGPSKPTPAAPQRPVPTIKPEAAPQDPGVVRREDYLPPIPTTDDKVPVLPLRTTGDKTKKKLPDAPRPDARPAGSPVMLAPMPTVKQPEAKPGSQEPAPQKPELRLPIEALRANKPGSKPLSEHLKQHEQKRKQPAAAPGPPPEPGSEKANRHGKGKIKPAGDTDTSLPSKGRKGVATSSEEGGTSLLGGREARQMQRKRAPVVKRRDDEEGGVVHRPARRKLIRRGTNTAAPRKGKAVVELPCTVRSFSEAAGVPAQQVMRQLMALGTMLPITAEIPEEMAELLVVEMGLDVEFKRPVDVAEERLQAIATADEDPALLESRPPIITFLGHVDHGKTSLLDKIIGINVVAGESGGITQHIRAYQIERNGRKISFVDTPGHEAFTEMRARGANVTDIAVIVVAADDGVMPQTEEAISHAKAAEVPIVVALNKMDLPGVNLDRIYQQLATSDLLPSEWGGETEVIKTSALTGMGLDDLLETIHTISELHEYKANPNRAAYGTCIESEMHEGRGVTAKFMVQNGTLRVGDAVVCGSAYGRVKAMYDTLDGSIQHESAGPSMPVNITGLDAAPNAGEHFYVLDDISMAREIAEDRGQQSRRESLGGGPAHITLENLFERIQSQEEVQKLNIILRADVRGSIEAIRKELSKLQHPEIQLRILQATVGAVSEADVHLADASDAIIIGFNVVPDERARSLADDKGVQVRRYDIIYKITEDVRSAMEGMLSPEEQSVDLGRALVKRTFTISRLGTVAGCQVISGVIQRSGRARIIRDGRILGEYSIDSLKREKDDAREVRQGLECGIKLANFNDLKEGDILEVFKIEEVARTLE